MGILAQIVWPRLTLDENNIHITIYSLSHVYSDALSCVLALLMLLLLSKYNLMHNTPRHEGEKACEDKSEPIKGKHYLLMTLDISHAHEINRQTKRKDSPDTE